MAERGPYTIDYALYHVIYYAYHLFMLYIHFIHFAYACYIHPHALHKAYFRGILPYTSYTMHYIGYTTSYVL